MRKRCRHQQKGGQFLNDKANTNAAANAAEQGTALFKTTGNRGVKAQQDDQHHGNFIAEQVQIGVVAIASVKHQKKET